MNQYLTKVITAAKEKIPKKVGDISIIEGKLEGSTKIKYEKIFNRQKYPHKVLTSKILDLKKFQLHPSNPEYFQHDFHVDNIIYFGISFILPANDITNIQLPRVLTILGKELIHKRLIPELFWQLEDNGTLFVTLFLIPPFSDPKREEERGTGATEKKNALELMQKSSNPLTTLLGKWEEQDRHTTIWIIPKKDAPSHEASVKTLTDQGWEAVDQVSTKKESKTLCTKENLEFELHRRVEKDTISIDFTNLAQTHQD